MTDPRTRRTTAVNFSGSNDTDPFGFRSGGGGSGSSGGSTALRFFEELWGVWRGGVAMPRPDACGGMCTYGTSVADPFAALFSGLLFRATSIRGGDTAETAKVSDALDAFSRYASAKFGKGPRPPRATFTVSPSRQPYNKAIQLRARTLARQRLAADPAFRNRLRGLR